MMKRVLFLTSAFSFLIALSAEFSSRALADGSWYARAEALYLHRDDPETLDLVQDNFLPGDPAVLTTRSGEFDFEPGFRVTLGRYLGEDHALEASYFGIYNWSAAGRVTSADPALDSLETADSFFPSLDPFVTFSDFDEASFRADTEVHSLELNLRRNVNSVFTLVGGLRYIRVDDRFNILTSEIDSPPNTGTRSYVATATSDLFGIHLGGELKYDLTCRLAVELKGKAGLYLGYYDQNQTAFALTDLVDPIVGTIPAGTEFFSVGDDAIGMASTVEIGATAIYALSDCVNLRLGYEVMVWSGLALAPEQLNDSLISNEVHRDGIMVIGGATLGVDVNY